MNFLASNSLHLYENFKWLYFCKTLDIANNYLPYVKDQSLFGLTIIYPNLQDRKGKHLHEESYNYYL